MTDIREFWSMIVSAVVVVIWLVRLEGKVIAAGREIARLEEQMDEDRKDAKDSRRETHEILREIERDIKRLLERGSIQQHWNDPTIPPRGR